MCKDVNIKYRQLDKQNFEDFFYLLKLRGERDKNYFQWKYLSQPYNERPRGFIAYKEDKPVGCIGIINREIQNNSNKKYYATWFADWFVDKKNQGFDIGKTLIKNVFNLSDQAFGIVGPVPAQNISKKVGYNNLKGYYNIIIPLNIINCGMKRFSGGIHKKLFRTLKILYIHTFYSFIDRTETFSIKYEKPDIKLWIDSSHKCLNRGNRLFKLNKRYIKWLTEIPKKDNKNFSWWYIKNDRLFACGLVEKNIWGLSSINILDIYNFDEKLGYRSLLNTFLENKIDIVRYSKVLDDRGLNLYHKYFINELPMFTKSPIKNEKVFISNLDRENIWKDLPW